MQLAKLVGDGGCCLSVGGIALLLQIAERLVDTVDLPMGPALHAVPPAESLERGHRNVHRLLFEFVVDDGGEAVESAARGVRRFGSYYLSCPTAITDDHAMA